MMRQKHAYRTMILLVGWVGLLLLASCNTVPGATQVPLATQTPLVSNTGASTSTSTAAATGPVNGTSTAQASATVTSLATATNITPAGTGVLTDTVTAQATASATAAGTAAATVATATVIPTTAVPASAAPATEAPYPMVTGPAVPVVTDTPLVSTLTVTPASGQQGQCAYMWANQDLPDVSAQLTQAFTQAGFSNVQGSASAYGENCFDPQSNKVVSFSAMQTDFHLTVPVKDTSGTQTMGEWITKLLPILAKFPPGQVPGPNLGNVGFQFKDETQEQNLWFPLKKGQDLLQQGTTGSALFQALKAP